MSTRVPGWPAGARPASTPVLIHRSSTLIVKGWKAGAWVASDTLAATYFITLGTASTPTFAPAAGTYGEAQTVVVASATPGVTIRYTLDGSDPTDRSPVYSMPLLVDWTMTLKAKAFKQEWTSSALASAAYTINLTNTVAPATFSPPGGTYATTRSVTLGCGTSGSTLHYTTNGIDPTDSDASVACNGSVVVDRELPLKVKAYKAGMTPSPVRRANYRITGAASAGGSHGILLKVDGSVWTFGTNTYGQLGTGNTATASSPVQIAGYANAVSVAANGGFTLVAKADGTAWASGYNSQGQLGNGSTAQSLSPVQVSTSTGLSGVVAVAAGGVHSLALTSAGTVWAWGGNAWKQVAPTGSSYTTPVQVAGLSDVVAIAADDMTSAALKRDGTLLIWGANDFGQGGAGTVGGSLSAPTAVPGLVGMSAVSIGADTVVALKTDGAAVGTLWGWGQGGFGLRLDGTSGVSRLVPVRTFENVVAVSSSLYNTAAIQMDVAGRAVIWGAGNHFANSLNAGAAGSGDTPARIAGGSFSGLSVSQNILLALRRDLTVLSWGPTTGADGFVLGTVCATCDPDDDGLDNAAEWEAGTDAWTADTNGDGILDGAAVRSGRSGTNPDMDGDGVPNTVERQRGTDPFNPDTDGDGSGDGADCFPLDPTRWECPTPTPGDTTPPVITLTEPTNATLISSVP